MTDSFLNKLYIPLAQLIIVFDPYVPFVVEGNIYMSHACVTFLGILISCMSDVAFYYLRLDRYSIIVGMFWLHVRCHT